jgi:2-polyprenyl-6-methoxyphenol hydroxylase-like FAD-dependent oxidoreductase
MAQRRALVIGGSMSGLLAALMLRRRGWEVDIYERVGLPAAVPASWRSRR